MKKSKRRWVWFGIVLLPLGFAMLASWAFLGVSAERTLGLEDCRPKKLASIQACNGVDDGFQECHFYFRAVGTPVRDWCLQMQTSARPVGQPLARCDFAKPETFTRIDCGSRGVLGDADCYACTTSELAESHRNYVYAYRKDCSRGLEQVTCNVNAEAAAQKLGSINL